MKIVDLVPGMLLKPVAGYVWTEVPWTGTTGSIIGYYLRVVSARAILDEEQAHRNESVLYLGTTDRTSAQPTPGKQVVLAWGKKLTIDSTSWRHITT